jgi:hypothetical protein
MNFVLTGFQGNDGLKPGDEIGIFDGDLCVGAAVYDGAEVFGMSASMADPSSDIPLPGFTEGHKYTLRFWNHEKLQEYSNLSWAATAGSSLTFASFGTAFITFTGTETTEVSRSEAIQAIMAYPNPFRETVNLRMQLATTTDVSLHSTTQQEGLWDRMDLKAMPAENILLAGNPKRLTTAIRVPPCICKVDHTGGNKDFAANEG